MLDPSVVLPKIRFLSQTSFGPGCLLSGKERQNTFVGDPETGELKH